MNASETSILAPAAPEDVKPRIRPFPLDDNNDKSLPQGSSQDASKSCQKFSALTDNITPPEVVKKEPSSGLETILTRSHSPVYVSSDCDSEEVAAQMGEDGQPHSGDREAESAVQNFVASDEDEGSASDDEGSASDDDEREDTNPSVGEQMQGGTTLQSPNAANETNLSPRAPSSSLSPPPFNIFSRAVSRPQPKSIAPTQGNRPQNQKRPCLSCRYHYHHRHVRGY